jgi:hypothetical protein
VRVAHHPGFDRITFQFEGTSGVPQYKLVPQQSAGFMQDPSGRPLHLDGSAGLGIVFPGTSGMDLSVTPIRRTYNGSLDIKAGLLFVRELAQSGDFERVMSWGVGLSASPCLRVTELSNPARLAIDVRSAPSASSAAEIKAVAQRIFAGAYPMGCSPRDRSVCPVTDRLVARFTELSKPQPDQPGPPNLFCRCQNAASRSMTIDTETTPTGGIAHVTLYPDAFPIKIDLIVVSQGGKLLVDETQCTGRGPSTSIYAAPLTLCGS